METNPYSSPFSAGGPVALPPGQYPALDVVMPLYHVKGWLVFLGVLNMIAGGIYCITIIGAIIGWLPLWIGILLYRSAQSLQEGVELGNPAAAFQGIERLSKAIVIVGILMAIGIGLQVLYIAGVIVFAVLAATQQM